MADAALARIAAWDDPALFISRVDPDALRARARRLAEEGPRGRALFGVPFVAKDNIDVADMPTTAACPNYATTPGESAPAVVRLLAAGALPLGKTNLDQFATGLAGVRSPYGVPHNAVRSDLVPGGSSSGSATAVAAGLCAFSLGTDTAGSGRVPAMMNGIVALKPSLGLVPARGVVPACRSLDCVSVFAQTVADAAAVLAVIAGPDAADPYSRAPPPFWRAAPSPQPAWRVAAPEPAGGAGGRHARGRLALQRRAGAGGGARGHDHPRGHRALPRHRPPPLRRRLAGRADGGPARHGGGAA